MSHIKGKAEISGQFPLPQRRSALAYMGKCPLRKYGHIWRHLSAAFCITYGCMFLQLSTGCDLHQNIIIYLFITPLSITVNTNVQISSTHKKSTVVNCQLFRFTACCYFLFDFIVRGLVVGWFVTDVSRSEQAVYATHSQCQWRI